VIDWRSTSRRLSWPIPWLLRSLACAVCIWAASTSALAKAQAWEQLLGIDPSVSYKATSIMTTPMGEFTMVEHQMPGRQSVQMNVGGIVSTIINRDDLDVSYMLLPAMKLYREVPQTEARSQTGQDLDYSDIKKVGREKVAGHAATKYQATFATDEGTGTGLVWVTDSGILAKVDMQYGQGGVDGGNFQREMTELVVGKQKRSLFEVPKNFKPMNVGALMGVLGGMGKAQQTAKAKANNAATPPTPSAATSANDSGAASGKVKGAAVSDELADAAGEVTKAAKEEARTGIVENTRNRVREGIRGLFGRKKQ